MSQPSASLAERLQSLERKFLDQLPERIRELENGWRDVREGSPERFDELVRLAHRLAGSGGIFGIQKVSEIGARLEEIFSALAEGGSPDDTTRQEIEREIEALKGLC